MLLFLWISKLVTVMFCLDANTAIGFARKRGGIYMIISIWLLIYAE